MQGILDRVDRIGGLSGRYYLCRKLDRAGRIGGILQTDYTMYVVCSSENEQIMPLV